MLIYYLFIIAFGLAIGSFLNVCIYRLPVGDSIIKPPSHCLNCDNVLKWTDLVPVVSFLILRGRCRYCKAKISPRYVFVEAITAVIFTLLFAKYGFTIEFIAMAYLMSILIIVLFIDIDHRIIPNELVIAGLAGAGALFIINIFWPMGFYENDKWWTPIFGIIPGAGFLLLVAIVGIIIYGTDDAMGMGDVKIFAPIGIFLGWKLCIVALFISIIIGGVLGLILVIAKIKKRKDAVPFGPFIVIGTFVTIMWGQRILEWYISRMLG